MKNEREFAAVRQIGENTMAERILIIDDEQLNLKMTKHYLEGNYEVLCASSGGEGLAILHDTKVDLVLLDLDMPGMDGMATLMKIRAEEQFVNVKVAMLTASGLREDVTEAIRLGALDFIKKPIFPAELNTRVKKILHIERKDQLLVVDDDRMNLMMAKRMLGVRYDVHCESSGKEALDYLRKHTPDLILLDLHMPEMSGLDVLGKIRQMERVSEIPVIFLTADSDRQTEVELFKAGAMDYIQKPFAAEVVIRRISRILELYHYQHSLQAEVDKTVAELRESNRKVSNLTTQVMLTLASAIDAKDAYTKGHSVRVAQYARELARRMGKSEEEISDIYYIGLLHDIGKIGVADRIINKPERLTKEEYDEVKAHPVIGAEILDNISEIPGISIGAHWHHERYDGGGYPDGLAGTAIPEVARIVCVADAYDTMTSKRKYRDIMSQSTVRAELLRGRGTQFDPEIVDHMLAMINEDPEYQMHE